jgi:Uma2 family endonuclease
MTQAAHFKSPHKFLTLEDYLAFDNGADTQFELVNGELVEMPTESDLNGLIVVMLMFALSRFVPPNRFRIKTEIAVSGYRATCRLPDLMVLTAESAAALQGAERSILLPDMPPPALVVEVVSPGIENAQRDYRYKRSEYAARGIQEYWVVDPNAAQVMVLTLVAGLYEEAVFKGDQRIVSTLFPELQLTAAQVLQANMD